MKNKVAHLILMLLFISSLSKAQDLNMFERGSFNHKADTINYRILFPDHFDPSKKYPLVFVLHGSGERGNDNNAQLVHGASLFLQIKNREKFPAIVIFPQCPNNSFWSNTKFEDSNGKTKFNFLVGGEPTRSMSALLGLVSTMLDKPFVDKHRVYVGGLSMGGMGTFEILRRKPNVFAAAFSICGGDNTQNAKIYAKKVPLWIFHGAKDQNVPPEHSEAMVVALQHFGGKPKFTLYANDGHNSWDDAFAEPELLPWLFSHSK